MLTLIQSFLEHQKDLSGYMNEKQELSLLADVNTHYRKIFLLSCASAYEVEILAMIKDFISNYTTDMRAFEFSSKWGITKKYHQYFEWDNNNKKQINSFLSLFGNEFSKNVSSEIRSSDDLQSQVEAFLIIGSERNKMVHNNFLDYSLEKTFEELIDLNNRATQFLVFLKSKFI